MNNLFSEPIWSRQARIVKSWLRYKYFSDDPESTNTHHSPRPGTKGKVTGQTCPNYAQTEQTNREQSGVITPPHSLSTEICVKTEEKQIWSEEVWGRGSRRSGGLGQVNCCISLARTGWVCWTTISCPYQSHPHRSVVTHKLSVLWAMLVHYMLFRNNHVDHQPPHHHNHPLYL